VRARTVSTSGLIFTPSGSLPLWLQRPCERLAAVFKAQLREGPSKPGTACGGQPDGGGQPGARLKLGPEGNDQEHRQDLKFVDQHVEPFARRGIDPMRMTGWRAANPSKGISSYNASRV
jgi:hypothetical protein